MLISILFFTFSVSTEKPGKKAAKLLWPAKKAELHQISKKLSKRERNSLHLPPIIITNHKNYNFLAFDWFKKGLFSTNSLAKLLSDSLLLDSLLLDSLLSDSSKSQSHSKM